ncbi:MAG: hypothetical protein ACRDZ8_03595 [Acidimicrobiales bacterium]
MSGDPEIDPASIGVSFVDILFALAVGQVFLPVALWAEDPVKNPLPLVSWLHLGVALTITITSWIGYHASANKARFQPQFVNVELVKLVLDISMVAVYFMLAAYAVHQPVETKPETLLVVVAFGLYTCWDLASAWQKGRRPNNPYREAWGRVFSDRSRPDVSKPWRPTDWGRVRATWVALLLAAVVGAYTWMGHGRPTQVRSILTDVALMAILIGYRILKEHSRLLQWHPKRPVRPGPSASPVVGDSDLHRYKVIRRDVSGAKVEEEVECSRISPVQSGATVVFAFERVHAGNKPFPVLVLPVPDVIRIELFDK